MPDPQKPEATDDESLPEAPGKDEPAAAPTAGDDPAPPAGSKGDAQDKAAAAKAEDAKAAPEPAKSAPAQSPSSQAPPPAAAAPPPKKSGGGIAWLALLLALAAVAMSGALQWQAMQEADSAERASQVDWKPSIDAIARDASAEASALRGDLAALETRLAGLTPRLESTEAEARRAGQAADDAQRETRTVREEVRATTQQMAGAEGRLRAELGAVNQRFDSVQQAVSALSEFRQSGEAQLLVAEAEFLLRLAGERLALFRDPVTAVSALELAQSHLRAVNDPVYGPVRRTLAGEIESLAGVDLPDLAALSGRIGRMAETSVNWPLDERRTLDRSSNLLEPTQEETGWWGRVREVVSEVAVVHRDTGEGTLMLTLEEERLLRENVRLQLQIAQLAAIRGDAALFRSSLETASRWVETYYDIEREEIQDALGSITELREIEISPALPDIGSSLRELRRVRALTETAGEAP